MIAAFVLYTRQQGLANATASEAAVYLQAVKHENYGFQFIATLYSLPKALLFWSLVSYIPQGSIIGFRLFGVMPFLVAGAVLLSLVMILYFSVSPFSPPCAFWRSSQVIDEEVKCAMMDIV